MAQYLISMLGGGMRGGAPMFMPMPFGMMGGDEHGGPADGRWGDYVFSQDGKMAVINCVRGHRGLTGIFVVFAALDQIITQIMEAGNASRPVPAPDDMIKNLPRDVLQEGSEFPLNLFSLFVEEQYLLNKSYFPGPLLMEDCAVCKDQFSTTADPNEQIVVTLPCKHPFHVDCIEPWLKSSGTCPVCRYVALRLVTLNSITRVAFQYLWYR